MSNNLNLPQLTAQTANKEQFIDDVLGLVDSSITSAVVIDASASIAVQGDLIRNKLKLVAANVPKAGTTLTLPPLSHLFVLRNSAASLGPVTYACGTASIVVGIGTSVLAHMDSTVNGLEAIGAVSSAAAPSTGTGTGTGTTTPAAAAVTATVWRLHIKTIQGQYDVAAVAEFVLTAGGKDLVPTSIASSGNDQRSPSNADDGDPNSYWAGGNGPTWDLTYTFSKAVQPDGFRITSRNDGYFYQSPKTIDIQYQNADASYAVLQSYQLADFTQGSTSTQTIDGQTATAATPAASSGPVVKASRFWRIDNLRSVSRPYVGTGELQWLDASGAVIPGVAPFSNGNDTDPIANVNDGNLSTFWTTGTTDGGGYVGLDLTSNVLPAKVRISSRNGDLGCNIATFSVSYSDDRSTWVKIANFAPATWNADSQTQDFALPAASGASNASATAGPYQLATYTVAKLPAGNAGLMAFATDGRKQAENAGSGTGVSVVYSGGAWRRLSDDAVVSA